MLPPETGEYEIIVRTEHSTRLWLNDPKKPLIDAWVKSGNDTEHRASIYLLGGRAYPLRLEFSKAKQGVDDSKKNPNPPVKPAFISLNWMSRGESHECSGRSTSTSDTPKRVIAASAAASLASVCAL